MYRSINGVEVVRRRIAEVPHHFWTWSKFSHLVDRMIAQSYQSYNRGSDGDPVGCVVASRRLLCRRTFGQAAQPLRKGHGLLAAEALPHLSVGASPSLLPLPYNKLLRRRSRRKSSPRHVSMIAALEVLSAQAEDHRHFPRYVSLSLRLCISISHVIRPDGTRLPSSLKRVLPALFLNARFVSY